MTLSESQVAAYVAGGGVECPHCGSPEIEASNQEFTDAGIFFDCECTEYLRKWREHYKLVAITPKEEATDVV